MIGYEVLILDLDGTIYIDGNPIGDIIQKLNDFNSKGTDIFYLSNNTSVSRDVYLKKLINLGLKVKIENIITPICVAGDFLSKKYKKGYIVGTSSFVNELEKEYNIKFESKEPDFVLVAFDKELTYDKLMIACEHINKGVPYYITHIDLACPSEKGPIPDCGSISFLIEQVTKKKPLADFGKPSVKMSNYIKKRISNHQLSEILMVGDRLYTDILLGNKLNIQTLLVLSGESKNIDYKLNTKYKVTHCSETLADFFEGITILK